MLDYDPSASLEANYIRNELHDLRISAGIIPVEGGFYEKDLKVEVSSDGINFKTLSKSADFVFSPLFVKPTYESGLSAYSYLVVLSPYNVARITYRAVGGETDAALLANVSTEVLDRRDARQWILIQGDINYDPNLYDRDWLGLGEAEAFSKGLESVRQELEKLVAGNDKATLPQVTAIEGRQSAVEAEVENALTVVEEVAGDFQALWDSYYSLEDWFANNGQTNTTYPDGFVYISDGVSDVHTFAHGLNTQLLTATVWLLDSESGRYVQSQNSTQATLVLEDDSNVRVNLSVGCKIMVALRTVSTIGYSETFQDATFAGVEHNLNTEFLQVAVWRNIGSGLEYLYAGDAITTAKAVSRDRLEITIDAVSNITVCLTPNTPQTFVYKKNDQWTEAVAHYFNSNLLDMTVWYRPDFNSPFMLSTAEAYIQSINDIGYSGIYGDYKVVLNCIGKNVTEFNQELLTQLQAATAVQVDIQSQIDELTRSVSGIPTVTIYEYDSDPDLPALVHTITHSLGTVFVRADVWVLQDNGLYQIEYPTVTAVDSNTCTVTLTKSSVIHVAVRRSDV